MIETRGKAFLILLALTVLAISVCGQKTAEGGLEEDVNLYNQARHYEAVRAFIDPIRPDAQSGLLYLQSCEGQSWGGIDDGENGTLDEGVPLNSFPDLSGLTWMGEDRLLAVCDAKSKPGEEDDPRVGILSISETLEVTLTNVEMDWCGEELSDDLESVCTLSAISGDFLASESGQEGDPFTRIFRIEIEEQGDGWSGRVVDVFPLPKGTVNVEGMECLACDLQKATILLGERGGSDECPDGKLRVCEIDFASGNVSVLEEIAISIEDVDWTDPEGHRDISDLYLDSSGTLWGVATEDPADAGPWRSVIYEAGTVNGTDLTIADEPIIAAQIDGLKVESLAAPIVEGCRFSIGTDDESYGGIWRPVA